MRLACCVGVVRRPGCGRWPARRFVGAVAGGGVGCALRLVVAARWGQRDGQHVAQVPGVEAARGCARLNFCGFSAARARARFREVVLHGTKDVENEFRVSEMYLGVWGSSRFVAESDLAFFGLAGPVTTVRTARFAVLPAAGEQRSPLGLPPTGHRPGIREYPPSPNSRGNTYGAPPVLGRG